MPSLFFFRRRRGGTTALTFREALVFKLASCAAMTSICGSRIFPGMRPEDAATNPCVVYTVLSDKPGVNLLGQDGTAIARVKIEFVGPDITQCVAMQLAFAAAFAGFQGTIGGHVFIRAKIDDEDDDAQPADTGSDDRVQTVSDTYVIRHRIPVTRF
jgi:hypothetical protein